MARFRFDVTYVTGETKRQVKRLLRERCSGSWRVHRLGLLRRGEFRIFFERESDIRVLCQPS